MQDERWDAGFGVSNWNGNIPFTSVAPDGGHVLSLPLRIPDALGPSDVRDDKGGSVTLHDDREHELWS